MNGTNKQNNATRDQSSKKLPSAHRRPRGVASTTRPLSVQRNNGRGCALLLGARPSLPAFDKKHTVNGARKSGFPPMVSFSTLSHRPADLAILPPPAVAAVEDSSPASRTGSQVSGLESPPAAGAAAPFPTSPGAAAPFPSSPGRKSVADAVQEVLAELAAAVAVAPPLRPPPPPRTPPFRARGPRAGAAGRARAHVVLPAGRASTAGAAFTAGAAHPGLGHQSAAAATAAAAASSAAAAESSSALAAPLRAAAPKANAAPKAAARPVPKAAPAPTTGLKRPPGKPPTKHGYNVTFDYALAAYKTDEDPPQYWAGRYEIYSREIAETRAENRAAMADEAER